MANPSPQIRPFTAPDGYQLSLRKWEVENPLAHVVCLHGIVSHGGWYLASCDHLAADGFGIHMLDRRGSGLNRQRRGDVDRWETWPQDVESYLETLPRATPRILLGISWGGTLATAVARRRPDLLQGLGLICPGLYSKKAATLPQRAALGIAQFLPVRSRHVTIPLRDPALFTNSESHQAYIANDPLTLRKMTIGFALANQKLVRYATEKPQEIHVPTLLMLAGDDPISNNAKLREFVGRMGGPSPRIIEYPGASHTLEFEPDPSDYFRDLNAWCRERAAAGVGKP